MEGWSGRTQGEGIKDSKQVKVHEDEDKELKRRATRDCLSTR